MGLSQSTQNFVSREIDRIAQDARMEAAQAMLGMAHQEEQAAANIWGVPSGPSTPSSRSYVSGTTANLGSTRSTPNTRSSAYGSTPVGVHGEYQSTPAPAAAGPSSGLYVPETPFDEYGRPIYRQGGFRQPRFGGVEYDDVMRNQRGF